MSVKYVSPVLESVDFLSENILCLSDLAENQNTNEKLFENDGVW